ncbi:MAG: DUF2087 domain-containing protein [Candidatus Limnocylindria bacterium]
MSRARDPASHARYAFFRNGRLAVVPAKRTHRVAVLTILSERFERGRRYPEREVNALLADDGPDHATLRRLLVDEGLLRRDSGEYWRDQAGE